MGLADYMSRNPSELAKRPSTYDENFIIAQLEIIKETFHILRKRGRPKKQSNTNTQHNNKTTHNESNVTKTNALQWPHDSNQSMNYQTKRQRGRPRKLKMESSNESTQIKNNSDKHRTNTNNLQTNLNYNLRSSHKTFQPQTNKTNNDVINNTQITQKTITEAHLPINTAILKQPNFKQENEMEHATNKPNSATVKSPAQKTPFSMRNYLSPTTKQDANHPTSPSDDQLPKQLESIFNQQLIAAMINRDTVLREIRDCILNNDQDRCKQLSNQIHAKWNNLSVNNGCILVGNKLAIPNILKESVIDVLHSTHPGAWGMTELGQRLW